jgi:integrase
MLLLAYRHGLRAAEVVDLRWEQVDFKSATTNRDNFIMPYPDRL